MKRVKFFLGFFLLGFIVFSGITLVAAETKSGHTVHWGYEGKGGPGHWGELKAEFSACKNGKKQSPVDIVNLTPAKAPALEFQYKATPLHVVNNGHTIQVNYEPGSFLKIGSEKFELLQFHFHAPSEHSIKGKPLAMEMHLVHKNDDDELAVVGLLMIKSKANAGLDAIWKNLPASAGKTIKKTDIKINAADLLPKKRDYLFYSGSLTTPPCSEGVYWHVMSQSIPVSEEQVGQFTGLVKFNARPAQPLHDRKVTRAE